MEQRTDRRWLRVGHRRSRRLRAVGAAQLASDARRVGVRESTVLRRQPGRHRRIPDAVRLHLRHHPVLPIHQELQRIRDAVCGCCRSPSRSPPRASSDRAWSKGFGTTAVVVAGLAIFAAGLAWASTVDGRTALHPDRHADGASRCRPRADDGAGHRVDHGLAPTGQGRRRARRSTTPPANWAARWASPSSAASSRPCTPVDLPPSPALSHAARGRPRHDGTVDGRGVPGHRRNCRPGASAASAMP